MNYVYIPDSYNNNLIKEKYKSEEEFLNIQILYRQKFESILKKYIDFKSIDIVIKNKNINIPEVEDTEYNFYHKYTTLDSKYVFLRNNFHVENLTKDEIKRLLTNDINDVTFFNSTLSKVIFEDGDETFFGIPTDEVKIKSRSLVFEFAFDQTKIENIEELKEINNIIKQTEEYLKENIKGVFRATPSFIVYNSIPNLYQKNVNIQKK